MNHLQTKRSVKVLALLLVITTLIGLVSVASYAEEKKENKIGRASCRERVLR